jgi:hypothetical protein
MCVSSTSYQDEKQEMEADSLMLPVISCVSLADMFRKLIKLTLTFCQNEIQVHSPTLMRHTQEQQLPCNSDV